MLVGCYLNPLFGSLEFEADTNARHEMSSKAEEITRKLSRCFNSHVMHTKQVYNNSPIAIDDESELERSSIVQTSTAFLTPRRNICGMKRTFRLLDLADTEAQTIVTMDEVST